MSIGIQSEWAVVVANLRNELRRQLAMRDVSAPPFNGVTEGVIAFEYEVPAGNRGVQNDYMMTLLVITDTGTRYRVGTNVNTRLLPQRVTIDYAALATTLLDALFLKLGGIHDKPVTIRTAGQVPRYVREVL